MKEKIDRLRKMVNVLQVVEKHPDLYFITLEGNQLVMALGYLKNTLNFKHLAFMQAVDYLEDNKFMLTYMVYNYELKANLGVNVFIDREESSMFSIHRLWEHAWQYQRELYEMFGIDFPGSPRVDEPFIMESWEEMPPMRRDFDTLAYSQKTYFPRPGRETNDPKEQMKKAKYPNYPDSPKIRRDDE
ncbi:NADH-quinone oxidoreductase subunit C [bacterium]|nr:NADH-quinone oxidoreductase subunit C [bacterium]